VSGGQQIWKTIAATRPPRSPPWNHSNRIADKFQLTSSNLYQLLQSIMLPDEVEVEEEELKRIERKDQMNDYLHVKRYYHQHHRSAPLIELKGVIEGHQVRVLLDCGASCNYASKRMVNSYQLHTQNLQQPMIVELADGTQSEVNEELYQHRLVIPGFNGSVNLVVTNLRKYDVILGMPWFKKNSPLINWEKGEIEKVKTDEIESSGTKKQNKIPSYAEVVSGHVISPNTAYIKSGHSKNPLIAGVPNSNSSRNICGSC